MVAPPQQRARGRAAQGARLWQWALAAALAAALARGDGAAAGGGGGCRRHGDCGAAEFCAARACTTVEGFSVSCGVCRACKECRSHFAAIDARCPARCGAPLLATGFLRGHFFSVDASACLSLWRFEGHTFERFRTGLSYSWLAHPGFSPAPGDDSPCRGGAVQRGIFSLRALDSGAALTLRIPQDWTATYYQTLEAYLEQAQPDGLALSWEGSAAGERMVPFSERDRNGTRAPGLSVWAHQTWKGALQAFDASCEAMLELRRMPTAPTAPPGGPTLHVWQLNTWNCIAGRARAPGMPDLGTRSMQSPPGRAGDSGRAASRSLLDARDKSAQARKQHRPQPGTASSPVRRELPAGSDDDDLSPAPAWPHMPAWVLAVNTTSVLDFVSSYNDSWLMPGACNINGTETVTEGPVLGCTAGARCRRAIMTRQVYEWIHNENNTARINHPGLMELQPTRIARCVCDAGYTTTSQCVDSTLNHTRFVRQPYFAAVAHAYKDKPFMAARCTDASQIRMQCEDIDECAAGTHDCHPDALCSNSAGSFSCQCLDGYRDAPEFFEHDSRLPQGVACVDVDECTENIHNCFLHANCSNTKGNFSCTCAQGLEGDGQRCTHLSEVQIEGVWSAGVKLGLFFSWHLKVEPHPRDLISIDVQPENPPQEWLGKSQGRNLQFFWLFTGAQGCSSQLTVAVGAVGMQANEFVMDCHRDSGVAQPWSGSQIQQLSPGYGIYTARLFSYRLKEVVATHRLVVTNNASRAGETGFLVLVGLEPHSHDLPGMDGGLRGCVTQARLHPHLPVPLSPTIANPELTHTCAAIEIPTFQGTTFQDVVEDVPLRCGDGRLSLNGNETCDDGNTFSGDGCSSACTMESHTTCTYVFNEDMQYNAQSGLYSVDPPDSHCTTLRCGDTKINIAGETCDDGNINDYDGCSSRCTVETGFTCEHTSQWNFDVDPPVMVDVEICEPFVVRPWPACSLAGQCHPLGECVLFKHVEFCSCQRGYSATGLGGTRPNLEHNQLLGKDNLTRAAQHCQDVDECAFSSPDWILCPEPAVCKNTLGSFICDCVEGTEANWGPQGQFISCQDMDECALSVCVPPEMGGVCTNSYGSFACACARGFTGSGLPDRDGCADVNECADNTHTCSSTQKCINSAGSYFCECLDRDLQLNGKHCFRSGYWNSNRPLLQELGYEGKPAAAHGLLRMWDLPGYHASSQGAVVGAAQWVISRKSQDSVAGEGAGTDADAHSLHGSLFFTRKEPRSSSATELSDMLATNADDPWMCASQAADSTYVTASEGLLKVDHKSYAEDINISWVFAPQDDTISELYLHWHEFNLMHSGVISTERNISERNIVGQVEWVSLCRHRRPEDLERFLELDPDRTGYLILSEFNRLSLVAGLTTEEIQDRFAALDTDGDRKIFFHEWDGELCKYFTAANAPNQTRMRVPFTMMLSGNQMAPGINWHAGSGDHKIVVSFSPQKGGSNPYRETGAQEIKPENSTNVTAQSQPAQPAEQLFLSISNHMTTKSDFSLSSASHRVRIKEGTLPCAIARTSIANEYSTLSLTSDTTAAVENMELYGAWTGTCNPRRTATGTAKCRVDFLVRKASGSFHLVISGCGGYDMENFAEGFLQEHEPSLPFSMHDSRFVARMHRRVDLSYAYGLPKGSWLGTRAFASVVWEGDSGSSPQTAPEIVINIFRTGEGNGGRVLTAGQREYPGDVYQNADSQYYPCQVLTLKRVGDQSEELRVPAPGGAQLAASLDRRFRFRDLYLQFNASLSLELHKHYFRHATCAGSMETFMTSEASVLEDSTIDAGDCRSPCMPALNMSLSRLVATHGNLWQQFLAESPGDETPQIERREYEALKRFFAAQVLFVAEFLARVSLTCTANYLGLACNAVFATRPHVERCSALSSIESSGGALKAFGSWLSFRVGGNCRAECQSEVQGFVYESQCCSQRIVNVQKEWAAFVLPVKTDLELDLVLDVSVYKCVYRRAALSSMHVPYVNPLNCSTQATELVSLHLPDSVKATECGGKYSGGQIVSLQCALPECSLVPALTIPEACCSLRCVNNGNRSYPGVCFCDCPPAFAGATCSREVAQVRAAIAIGGTHYVTFRRDAVLAALAEHVSVPANRVEIGHIRVLGPSIRRVPTSQVPIPKTSMQAQHVFCASSLTCTLAPNSKQVLDVGFRVVGMQTSLEVMRMVQILNRGMKNDNIQQLLAKRGLGLASNNYLEPPTPHLPQGAKVCGLCCVCSCAGMSVLLDACMFHSYRFWKQACIDTPSDNYLNCADFMGVEAESTEVATDEKGSGFHLCPTCFCLCLHQCRGWSDPNMRVFRSWADGCRRGGHRSGICSCSLCRVLLLLALPHESKICFRSFISWRWKES